MPSKIGLETIALLDEMQRSHGDPMHLGPEGLRAIIGQALAAGTFVVCHDTLTYGDYPDYGPAICRGFFDAYASQSPALVLLQAYRRLTEVPRPPAALRLTRSPEVPGPVTSRKETARLDRHEP